MANEATHIDGALEPAGDRWRLRFTRKLDHAPESVWRAITETEHLDAWFPFHVEGSFEAGAPLQFRARDIDLTFPGEMIEFRPPSVMEFRWSEGELIRLEIQPDGNGCVLTLLNTIDELGKAARDGSGWHTCLDDLELDLAGQPRHGLDRDRFEALRDAYAARFGPDASAIGPPADHPYAG